MKSTINPNVIVFSEDGKYVTCLPRVHGPGFVCGICGLGFIIDAIDAKCTRCDSVVVDRKKMKLRSPEEAGLKKLG